MKILAISGSLRKDSYNTAIIRTLKRLEINNVEIDIYSTLDELPFFNPDLDQHSLEEDHSPQTVQVFRQKVAQADALFFSTPEYAYEIPGVLKNALDWLVSSSAVVNKPVAVVSVSTSGMGGDKAHKVLSDLMKVISAQVVVEAGLCIARANKKFDAQGEIIDEQLFKELKSSLGALLRFCLRAEEQTDTKAEDERN